MSFLFEEALAEAEKLDGDFKATGKLRGGFHGVPVTFKDQCKPSITINRPSQLNHPSM
ncbi:hypothetical protein FRC06_001749 [Ceratobasidium sp. 370]|nr:hypothetical protein FRC06_001749 [Ceratobasidium sp. 370]